MQNETVSTIGPNDGNERQRMTKSSPDNALMRFSASAFRKPLVGVSAICLMYFNCATVAQAGLFTIDFDSIPGIGVGMLNYPNNTSNPVPAAKTLFEQIAGLRFTSVDPVTGVKVYDGVAVVNVPSKVPTPPNAIGGTMLDGGIPVLSYGTTVRIDFLGELAKEVGIKGDLEPTAPTNP